MVLVPRVQLLKVGIHHEGIPQIFTSEECK